MRTHAMASQGTTLRFVAAPADRNRPASIHAELDIRTDPIPVGAAVEVRSRFDDRWTHGFSVATVRDGAYQLRRLSDGSILPAWFPSAMVRTQHV
jgi:hypothetical protein